MSHLPARNEALRSGLSDPTEPFEGEGGPRRVPWSALARHRWTIIACTFTVVAITLGVTGLTVPVYEGSSTLRIEQKAPNLPEVFRTLSSDGKLVTEIEELRSRTLTAEVVTELGLRLVLLEPDLGRRSDLLQGVRVTDSAPAGDYRLVREPQGQFALLDEATGQRRGQLTVGERIEFGGFSFSLAPAALEYPRIRFEIDTLTAVAARVGNKISATQLGPDVKILKVSFRTPDRDLAWQVPQALVAHYVAQRQELQALETRSTIDFLRQQISTISTQLAESERELESYRERFDVIDPQAEATSQVGRLVSMQTQLGMLETDRSALASFLAEIDATAAARQPGAPSPYRRLLAFPTLLQSQAATGLLQSLTTAEDQRKALLTRRTAQDSDVRALDDRIGELERELRAIAATYLQGVTNQVQSLDTGLKDFRQQLRSIPEKELQYARLERQPKVLEGVYTMLQTRLKEAEVAAAASDPSVRVVDAAIPPTRPVWPKPIVNALAALVCGFLLGLAVAFVREHRDNVIRSRMDVRGSTGLPVIGLIPRIHKRGSSVALIAEPRKRRIPQGSPPPRPVVSRPQRQLPTRATYTFFGAEPSDQPGGTLETPVSQQQPAVERVALTISTNAGAIAEAYGILQTNIAFSRHEGPAKTLVFTSPLPGDGKTTTAVNLALSLAQRGIRSLLIDADLRRGVVHTVFQSAREPGLSEVLCGLIRFDDARRGISVGERGVMDYLTTGQLCHGDQAQVGSDAMRDLLVRVREEYDVVIIDTPPVNVITDAAVLASTADGVVLVARAGVTEAAALSYALDQLRHVRARVLGVVLNDIDLERDAAYDSTYKYFRDYEYSSSTG